MNALASRFSRNRVTFRSDAPLTDDKLRAIAPSIFAEQPHDSRSERYAYIATAEILARLRNEGFQPFMVAQTKVRDDARREHTKHMLRLRHASQINGTEANEIILLNSHDGSSAYQMLSGCFRFVCANGMVCGDISSDIRVPHKGDVLDRVVSGAYEVLDGFTRVVDEREGMKALTLNEGEQAAFGKAAIELKYDTELAPAPITERQVLAPRRAADARNDLWTTFNRVQEEPDSRWSPRPDGPRCTHVHARGRRHRPGREAEPCSVDAGQRDAKAAPLIARGLPGLSHHLARGPAPAPSQSHTYPRNHHEQVLRSEPLRRNRECRRCRKFNRTADRKTLARMPSPTTMKRANSSTSRCRNWPSIPTTSARAGGPTSTASRP